jgi:hypothetical protein
MRGSIGVYVYYGLVQTKLPSLCNLTPSKTEVPKTHDRFLPSPTLIAKLRLCEQKRESSCLKCEDQQLLWNTACFTG